MTRLLLLLGLALATWYYFPETRAMLLDVAEPVIVPVIRWGTEEEMGQLGRHVMDHERLTGQLPAASGWLAWLDYRYPSATSKEDPWGSIYQLEVFKDSIAVVSFGPDRTRGTDDDFWVVTSRE